MHSTSRKRITAGAVLAFTLPVLALTSCSSSKSVASGSTPSRSTSSGTSAAARAKLTTMQFVNPLPNYPVWKTTGQCMKAEADKLGVNLTESGPTGQTIDATVMISQIQQAIANNIGAIATLPASDAFAAVLKQAQQKGIVTGTFFGTGTPDSGADVNIGFDWSSIGQQMISTIAAVPGEHVVGLVAAGNSGVGKSWLDGVKAAARQFSNVRIAGEVYTGDDAAQALPQVSALLTAHPDITDIATHMGTTTQGAVAAIKAKALEGKVFLLGNGSDNGGTQALNDGYAKAIVMTNACGVAKTMVDELVDKSEGKSVTSAPVAIAVVTKDVLQQYLAKGWS